ncbi:glutathione peroxidase [Paraferrimonas sp. SM1919]|uniref:glutathione peroxidase n=1 Tax=Paraferrimonas sp. SM1919 TaxID=2662263 RepID=UPI0013D2D4DB|nr:glutathione peroxidase [Paraferrimonas sp. SM1919]
MSVYHYSVKDASGNDLPLNQFEGKVLLIVNTASKCGFTPQYKGLEALHRKYQDKGLVVLGFPCNQFGEQEPGDMEEITKFCTLNYDVSFPLMSKVNVKGDNIEPLFQYLIDTKKGVFGKNIKWNFTKFIVDKTGKPIQRFSPTTSPADLEVHISEALSA